MKNFVWGLIVGVVYFGIKTFLPRAADSIVTTGIFFDIIYFGSGIAFVGYLLLFLIPKLFGNTSNSEKSDELESDFKRYLGMMGGGFIGYNACVLMFVLAQLIA